MQLNDFLQGVVDPKVQILVVYEAEICKHFDAYLRQIWPEGKVLIVTETDRREYAERTLIPAMKAAGYEVLYCLCVKSAGSSYRAQIEESLSDGALDGIVGIAALGSGELFAEARSLAGTCDISCCALLGEFAPLDALDACGDTRPCADAIFFDLDWIDKKLHGDIRDAVQTLEVDVYMTKADVATAQALGSALPSGLLDAMSESMPPRLFSSAHPSEDELAQLCEAYMWRSAVARIFPSSSLQTVSRYHRQSSEFASFSPSQHAQVVAQIIDAALELESLEISPEDCANHQPPKEILRRTLQQFLLQDGLGFEWLTVADANFEDRIPLRNKLNMLIMNWDDYCTHLRPIADVLRAIAARHEEDEVDAGMKSLWLHAARFAPRNTFIKLMNDLRIIEPALYI